MHVKLRSELRADGASARYRAIATFSREAEALRVSMRSVSGHKTVVGVELTEDEKRADSARDRRIGQFENRRYSAKHRRKSMAKNQFGGFGGGGNMQQLMRQAQKLQEQMAKTQQELDEREYTAQAGGGMVSVTASGKGALKSIVDQSRMRGPGRRGDSAGYGARGRQRGASPRQGSQRARARQAFARAWEACSELCPNRLNPSRGW